MNAERRGLYTDFRALHEHADAPHAVAPLRPCRERPNRRAAENSDELAPSKANAHLPLLCQSTLSGRIARPKPAVLAFTVYTLKRFVVESGRPGAISD